jgi:G3E family GTPase
MVSMEAGNGIIATIIASIIAFIVGMLSSPLLSSKVRFSKAYTIIDGYMFEKQIKMLKSVLNQIKIADTILINKCDKINQKESAGITYQVKEYNPFCNIMYTLYANLPDTEIKIIQDNSSYAQMLTNINVVDCKPVSSPPDIKVETLISSHKISKENFSSLSELLEPLIRAKGFLRATDGSNWVVQSVYGDISFREYNSVLLRSEMVFFGDGLNTKLINKLFQS